MYINVGMGIRVIVINFSKDDFYFIFINLYIFGFVSGRNVVIVLCSIENVVSVLVVYWGNVLMRYVWMGIYIFIMVKLNGIMLIIVID